MPYLIMLTATLLLPYTTISAQSSHQGTSGNETASEVPTQVNDASPDNQDSTDKNTDDALDDVAIAQELGEDVPYNSYWYTDPALGMGQRYRKSKFTGNIVQFASVNVHEMFR